MSERTLRFVDSDSEKVGNVHFVNFKSDKDENNIRTEEFFESQLKFNNNSNNNELNVSFRGRPMNGRKYNLPEPYQISMINKDKDNGIIAKKIGKTLTCWNLDKISSNADEFPQFCQWLKINDAIHGHVQIDD